MIKYVKTGGPYGDETSRYDVILDKQYTVKEFISAILEQNKDEWGWYRDWETDRKSTRLNSSHSAKSRMPSSA